MENQLNVLAESLDKKIQVLTEIQEYNKKQEAAFKNGQADIETFDEAVEEKGLLIEKLTRLDDGFEMMYNRLAEQLEGNREKYAAQIKEMQAKIKTITDMSMTIQTQEARNKKLIEDYFSKARSRVGQNRKSSRAAYDYYKNMSGSGLTIPRYMDDKK